MKHTAYSNYSDEELLRAVSVGRLCSPIIEELSIRIERKADQQKPAFVCPVCEAELLGFLDPIDNSFNVGVK